MKKKTIGYLVFFIILTAGFLFFVFVGTENWKTKLPTLSTVKPFNFSNQDGHPFTEQNMVGKVSVVEYFFTTCKGICPKMNGNMQTIYQEFKDQPDFQVVAYTCDPETDSIARLKQYADSLKLNTKKWILVTGSKQELYNTARTSYLLDDPKNNVESIEDQFLHTQFFALVDKNGQVRGQIYDGLKKDELSKLKKDIAVLLKEKQGSSSFANGIFNNTPQ
jgi:protein SCO1/2